MISNDIQTIESEYEKVNRRWLNLHMYISIGVAIASFLLEAILFFIMNPLGLIEASPAVYAVRYLLIPTGLNILILSLVLLLRRIYPKHLTMQAYAISIGLVAICFVLFTIHSIFPSLYFLFAIPLMLSCLYGNYMLTSVTAICAFIARIVGDVVITWDSARVEILTNGYTTVNFAVSLLIMAGFYIACLVLIYFEQEKNHAAVKKEIERVQFRQGMIADQLTMLYNRTALNEVLTHLSDEDAGLVCAMLDIDYFKEVNDTLGHQAGDEYLRKFSDLLRTTCDQHLLFRYVGDEFCILFNGLALEEATLLCRRLSRDSGKILDPGSIGGRAAAASYGLSVYESGQNPEDLIKAAEAEMYEMKRRRFH